MVLTGSQECHSGDWYGYGSSHATITFNKLKLSYDGTAWAVTSGSVSVTTWMTSGGINGAYATNSFVPVIESQ